MTNLDIILTIFSEISGHTIEAIREKIPPRLLANPKINQPLPDDEAQALLAKLRLEKEVIKQWGLEGLANSIKRNTIIN